MTNEEGRGPGRRAQPERPAREAILDAAFQVLAEQGFEAATIKQIARVAGVAPGLVHYYFASKQELLAEVVGSCVDRVKQEVEVVRHTQPPERMTPAALSITRDRVKREPEWYRLRYELFALALRHPELRRRVQELLATSRQSIGDFSQAVAEANGLPLPDPTGLGAVLLACFDGLALQRLVDPDFDLDNAYAALIDILDGYIEQRRRSARDGPPPVRAAAARPAGAG